MQHIIIIGGGVMGLSIAKHLPASRYNITILDRSTPRMNASYAAGGMLGAQNEFFEDTPLYRLAMQSRALMPEVARTLQLETGIDIEFQSYGLIKLTTDATMIDQVHQQYEFLKSDDHRIQWFDARTCQRHFPHLSPETTAAFKIQNDGQVNANLYTQALTQAVAQQHHTHIQTHTEVETIVKHATGSGYTVHTSKGTLHADLLVIAAGAWSGKLLQQLDHTIETHPVKGDVKLVETDTPLTQTTLFNTNGCYIVPKKPNRYLIGATSEWDNWEIENNDANLQWLDTESQRMIPQLKQHRVIKSWTGIRPITLNETPVMGQLEDDLFVATGHYRNGILLSPIVGQLMAQMIEGDANAQRQLSPFSPN